MEQNNSVQNEEFSAEQPVAENSAAPTAAPAEKPSNTKKTLNLVTACLSLGAIVFAFIFTFLIGIAVKGFGGLGSAMIIDSLKNLADIFKSLTSGGTAAIMIEIIFRSLFPIIVLIAFIIVELVYLILGVLRFINVIKGKETKSVEKLAISSYVYYATAASLIFALSGIEGLEFNPATYAGLIICGLLVSAIIIIKVILRGKDMLKSANLVPAILAAAAVVLSAVVVGLCAGPIASGLFPVDIIAGAVATPGKATVAAVAGVVALGAIAGFLDLIGKLLRYLIDGKMDKRAFMSSISMFVLMLLGVIFLYVGLPNVDGARLIVAAVFALLVMGCMIAYKVLSKELAEEPKADANTNTNTEANTNVNTDENN